MQISLIWIPILPYLYILHHRSFTYNNRRHLHLYNYYNMHTSPTNITKNPDPFRARAHTTADWQHSSRVYSNNHARASTCFCTREPSCTVARVLVARLAPPLLQYIHRARTHRRYNIIHFFFRRLPRALILYTYIYIHIVTDACASGCVRVSPVAGN